MSTATKVCVITGGGTGVGRATGIKLAQRGFAVVLVGRTAATLNATKDEVLAAGGQALAFPCDVSDYDSVQGMIKSVLQELGRVDALVNSVGLTGRDRTLSTAKPVGIEERIKANLVGPMYCCQAVLPGMLARREGTIVNVSSLAAHNPNPVAGLAYSAAKAGLVNFTSYLNVELRNTGVRACCVIPGEIDTPALQRRPLPPSRAAQATMLKSEDVADAIILAVIIPHRALVEEIAIRPTMVRDRSKEAPPLEPLLDL